MASPHLAPLRAPAPAPPALAAPPKLFCHPQPPIFISPHASWSAPRTSFAASLPSSTPASFWRDTPPDPPPRSVAHFHPNDLIVPATLDSTCDLPSYVDAVLRTRPTTPCKLLPVQRRLNGPCESAASHRKIHHYYPCRAFFSPPLTYLPGHGVNAPRDGSSHHAMPSSPVPSHHAPATTVQGGSFKKEDCPPPPLSKAEFLLRTKGRCFRYLSRDHRIRLCRDPIRCLRCLRQGHKHSFCRATLRTNHSSAPTVSPPCQQNRSTAPHSKQSPSPSRRSLSPPASFRHPAKMKNFRVGDPALKPEEDRLHVPTSFELERELRDWEGCALVTWAMRVPPNTTARHLEKALIAEFRLRSGDVDITRHHRKRFLSASKTGGPLELVERIVGCTSSLQCVDTDLLHLIDTRGIELWAWMADPSRILKDVAVGELEQRRLPWYWGVRDGDQVPTASFEPFQHPPPHVQERRNEREEEDRRDRVRRDCIDDHPSFHDVYNGNDYDDDNDDHDQWPRGGSGGDCDVADGRGHRLPFPPLPRDQGDVLEPRLADAQMSLAVQEPGPTDGTARPPCATQVLLPPPCGRGVPKAARVDDL
uniref:Uncharacterized protein n=1 Tax=Setaria viridis TaxID=4556 RepID=A0A4U6WCT3_SETVI|nr:LOW QUALITY PROTEIN: hypothetical protein SEVIR_1G254800v2 [Setaria viridis]